MEKRRIGKHGLEVSALCLGTMTFGYQIEESISREILDKAMDHRIVFMDTSDAYPLGGHAKSRVKPRPSWVAG